MQKTRAGIVVPSGTALPTHMDEQMRPWKISMYVVDRAESDTPRLVTYFARARLGDHAAAVCERCWQVWEKKEKGLEGQVFPDVRGKAHAVALDEGDWKGYLQDAIRFGHTKGLQLISKGQWPNPVVWTVPGLTFSDDRLREELPEQADFVDKDLKGLVSSPGE